MNPPKLIKGAEYQRVFRQRMAEQGLVRKDAWILPEHAPLLSAVARALQRPGSRILIAEGTVSMEQKIANVQALQELLASEFNGANIDIAMLQGVDPVIECRMHDHGGLPILVAISGGVIIAQADLWPETWVKDPSSFNRQVMLSEKLFGLANISLERMANGEVHYVAYGALRTESSATDIAYEIQALAHSVIDIAETFRPYLKA